MFHHLDFPRLFLCESTGYSKHKTTGIASVAICGGSNHILTGLSTSLSIFQKHEMLQSLFCNFLSAYIQTGFLCEIILTTEI